MRQATLQNKVPHELARYLLSLYPGRITDPYVFINKALNLVNYLSAQVDVAPAVADEFHTILFGESLYSILSDYWYGDRKSRAMARNYVLTHHITVSPRLHYDTLTYRTESKAPQPEALDIFVAAPKRGRPRGSKNKPPTSRN